MPVQIIAIPGDHPGLLGHGLASTATALAAAAPSRGHRAIAGYDRVESLIAKIRSILESEKDCLSVLEIQAHGDATLCDGIGLADGAGKDRRRDAKGVARQIAKLALCDEVAIYLSACNTGVLGREGAGSIAARLAGALPVLSPAFPHRITVWGTRGYFGGTHMGGNARCAPIVWGKLAPRAADYPPYEEALSATGSGCWRPFRNGW